MYNPLSFSSSRKFYLPLLLAVAGLFWQLSALAQTPVPDQAPQPTHIRPPLPEPPELAARSYFLVDFASGKVLAEKDPDLELEPASITKVMTSYVVFSELASGNLQLDEEVHVSEKAWRMGGSRMFIEVDTKVKVEDLIRGMVVASGNDASVALAEHIAGSESAFADLMNQYARKLGMDKTYFLNATGWPAPNHVTTARDIAILSIALIRDFPDYYPYYKEKSYEYNKVKQPNRNTLLFRDDSVDGLKTGHTEAAGYCLAATSVKEDMRLISVVMGTESEQARADQSQALLNYGHRFFESRTIYQLDEIIGQSKLWKGKQDQVPVKVARAVTVTIPRGRYEDLNARLGLNTPLQAPVEAGQELGQLEVSLDGEVLTTVPLLAAEAVAKGNLFKGLWHSIRLATGAGDD